jgi:hypothetical protein
MASGSQVLAVGCVDQTFRMESLEYLIAQNTGKY